MPFYYGPTSAVAAVYNTLVTNVQAEIDRIWTEFGDVATVPKPSTASSTFKLRFYKHYHLSRADYPHIMVYGTGGNMASGSDEIDVSDWEHQVVVEWWLKGDSETLLQEQSGRLGWAIWRCLANNSVVLDGTMAGLAMAQPHRYELGVAKPTGPYNVPLRGGRLPVSVHRVEPT